MSFTLAAPYEKDDAERGKAAAAVSEITPIKLRRDREAALDKSALLAGTSSDP